MSRGPEPLFHSRVICLFLAGGGAAGGAAAGGVAGGGDHGQGDEVDHQNNAGPPPGQLPVSLASGGAGSGLSGVAGPSGGASGGGPGL